MKTHAQKYHLPVDWENAVNEWLTWLSVAGVPETTRRLRRGHVRRVAKLSGTVCPGDITLKALVRVCSEYTWSNEHRRGVRRSLVAFFDWASAQKIIPYNPAVELPKVPAGKPCPRPIPDPMWKELLIAAGPRERMMVRLAGEVGMRRSEVARCHRNDMVCDLTGWSLIVHGKGGRQRVVPIVDSLAHDIMAFCQSGYLFPGQVDGHLSAHYVGKLIGNLMPDGWSMHKLRHRYATKGLAATKDLMAVRDALGHVSVATTQIYTAVANDRVRKVSEAASKD